MDSKQLKYIVFICVFIIVLCSFVLIGTFVENPNNKTNYILYNGDPMILTIDPKIDGNNKYNKRFRIQTPDDYKYKVSGVNVVGSSQICSGNCNVTLSSSSKTDIKIHAKKLHIKYDAYHYIKGSEDGILEIKKWGDIKWTSFDSSFQGANNLTVSANDEPDLSGVKDMTSMFEDAESLNNGISDWNTSNVEDMRFMFYGAKNFNQSLNNWNTSNVENMRGMFREAESFNQSVTNWNTSNVENMEMMFAGAKNFNQSLNNWNTSNVEKMGGMFHGAKSFNQSLNNWNTSNVGDMRFMFYEANNFNENLSGWNVRKVRVYDNFGLSKSKSPNWNNS